MPFEWGGRVGSQFRENLQGCQHRPQAVPAVEVAEGVPVRRERHHCGGVYVCALVLCARTHRQAYMGLDVRVIIHRTLRSDIFAFLRTCVLYVGAAADVLLGCGCRPHAIASAGVLLVL